MYEWEFKPALGYSVQRAQVLGFQYQELFLLRFYFLWINDVSHVQEGYKGMTEDAPITIMFFPVKYRDFLEVHPGFRTQRRLRATFDRLCGISGKRAAEIVTEDYNPYPLRKKLVHLQSNTLTCFASISENIEWLEGEENAKGGYGKILEFRKSAYV